MEYSLMSPPIPGEAAAAAGIPVVVNTDSINDGFTEHNISRDLIASVLESPALDASDVITGIFDKDRIPAIVSTSEIPNLPASHITAGVFSTARIPSYLQADTVTAAALARNGSGSAPWYAVWMNSDRQIMRNTSSERYKENIRDYPRGLDAILGLRPVIFDRIGTETPNNEAGFIAEEVNEYIPEAVTYYDDNIDGLYELPLIATLVGAVHDLAARLESIEATLGGTK